MPRIWSSPAGQSAQPSPAQSTGCAAVSRHSDPPIPSPSPPPPPKFSSTCSISPPAMGCEQRRRLQQLLLQQPPQPPCSLSEQSEQTHTRLHPADGLISHPATASSGRSPEPRRVPCPAGEAPVSGPKHTPQLAPTRAWQQGTMPAHHQTASMRPPQQAAPTLVWQPRAPTLPQPQPALVVWQPDPTSTLQQAAECVWQQGPMPAQQQAPPRALQRGLVHAQGGEQQGAAGSSDGTAVTPVGGAQRGSTCPPLTDSPATSWDIIGDTERQQPSMNPLHLLVEAAMQAELGGAAARQALALRGGERAARGSGHNLGRLCAARGAGLAPRRAELAAGVAGGMHGGKAGLGNGRGTAAEAPRGAARAPGAGMVAGAAGGVRNGTAGLATGSGRGTATGAARCAGMAPGAGMVAGAACGVHNGIGRLAAGGSQGTASVAIRGAGLAPGAGTAAGAAGGLHNAMAGFAAGGSGQGTASVAVMGADGALGAGMGAGVAGVVHNCSVLGAAGGSSGSRGRASVAALQSIGLAVPEGSKRVLEAQQAQLQQALRSADHNGAGTSSSGCSGSSSGTTTTATTATTATTCHAPSPTSGVWEHQQLRTSSERTREAAAGTAVRAAAGIAGADVRLAWAPVQPEAPGVAAERAPGTDSHAGVEGQPGAATAAHDGSGLGAAKKQAWLPTLPVGLPDASDDDGEPAGPNQAGQAAPGRAGKSTGSCQMVSSRQLAASSQPCEQAGQQAGRNDTCLHGRRRYFCRLCGGAGVCPHRANKYTCTICTQRCRQHGQLLHRCLLCHSRADPSASAAAAELEASDPLQPGSGAEAGGPATTLCAAAPPAASHLPQPHSAAEAGGTDTPLCAAVQVTPSCLHQPQPIPEVSSDATGPCAAAQPAPSHLSQPHSAESSGAATSPCAAAPPPAAGHLPWPHPTAEAGVSATPPCAAAPPAPSQVPKPDCAAESSGAATTVDAAAPPAGAANHLPPRHTPADAGGAATGLCAAASPVPGRSSQLHPTAEGSGHGATLPPAARAVTASAEAASLPVGATTAAVSASMGAAAAEPVGRVSEQRRMDRPGRSASVLRVAPVHEEGEACVGATTAPALPVGAPAAPHPGSAATAACALGPGAIVRISSVPPCAARAPCQPRCWQAAAQPAAAAGAGSAMVQLAGLSSSPPAAAQPGQDHLHSCPASPGLLQVPDAGSPGPAATAIPWPRPSSTGTALTTACPGLQQRQVLLGGHGCQDFNLGAREDPLVLSGDEEMAEAAGAGAVPPLHAAAGGEAAAVLPCNTAARGADMVVAGGNTAAAGAGAESEARAAAPCVSCADAAADSASVTGSVSAQAPTATGELTPRGEAGLPGSCPAAAACTPTASAAAVGAAAAGAALWHTRDVGEGGGAADDEGSAALHGATPMGESGRAAQTAASSLPCKSPLSCSPGCGLEGAPCCRQGESEGLVVPEAHQWGVALEAMHGALADADEAARESKALLQAASVAHTAAGVAGGGRRKRTRAAAVGTEPPVVWGGSKRSRPSAVPASLAD